MKEQIKNLRIKIDGLAQLAKNLKPIKYTLNSEELKLYNKLYSSTESGILNVTENYNSKEIEKAVDSLYLAKAWLGKILGELGTENPYGSGYKTKEDIVPTQDVNTMIESNSGENAFEVFNEKSHIEKVDWLRTEIEKCINLLPFELMQNSKIELFINNSYTHLSEARFWLGFEMERIKNN